MKLFKRSKRSHIDYCNMNSQINMGEIYVYVKGELKETIDVDDYLESHDEFYCPDDIIDEMINKYQIKKVNKRIYDWR